MELTLIIFVFAIIIFILAFIALTIMHPKPMSWIGSICIFLTAIMFGIQNRSLVEIVGGGIMAIAFYHRIWGSVEGQARLEARINEDACSTCEKCGTKLSYHPFPKTFSQIRFFGGLTCPNCESEFDIPSYIYWVKQKENN